MSYLHPLYLYVSTSKHKCIFFVLFPFSCLPLNSRWYISHTSFIHLLTYQFKIPVLWFPLMKAMNFIAHLHQVLSQIPDCWCSVSRLQQYFWLIFLKLYFCFHLYLDRHSARRLCQISTSKPLVLVSLPFHPPCFVHGVFTWWWPEW